MRYGHVRPEPRESRPTPREPGEVSWWVVAALFALLALAVALGLLGCGSGGICAKKTSVIGAGGGPSSGDRTCEVRR